MFGLHKSSKKADWPQLIGESVLLRQELHKLEPEIHTYTVPHVGATAEQIAQAETQLGGPLDPLHKHLLEHANGWESFFQYTHLLSTKELGKSKNWQQAEELLDILYADGQAPRGLPKRADMYCFSADPAQVEDLFVVWKTGKVTDGGRPVSWLAGEEVQRFPNMYAFMLSANEYLRRKIAKLQNRQNK